MPVSRELRDDEAERRPMFSPPAITKTSPAASCRVRLISAGLMCFAAFRFHWLAITDVGVVPTQHLGRVEALIKAMLDCSPGRTLSCRPAPPADARWRASFKKSGMIFDSRPHALPYRRSRPRSFAVSRSLYMKLPGLEISPRSQPISVMKRA